MDPIKKLLHFHSQTALGAVLLEKRQIDEKLYNNRRTFYFLKIEKWILLKKLRATFRLFHLSDCGIQSNRFNQLKSDCILRGSESSLRIWLFAF